FDTMFRNQADRILRDLDVVKREEFEAVKDMARLAREENETLKARIAALEAKLGAGGNPETLWAAPFFFPARAGARFLSSPIALAISAPNRRHGARLRQHGRSPDTPGGMLRRAWAAPISAAVLLKRICTMATTVKQMKAATRSRAGKGAA